MDPLPQNKLSPSEILAFLPWTPTLHPTKSEVRVINFKVSQCKSWDNRRTCYHLRSTSWLMLISSDSLTAWLLQHLGNLNCKMNLPLAGWNRCGFMHGVWASTRSHHILYTPSVRKLLQRNCFLLQRQMKSEKKNNNPQLQHNKTFQLSFDNHTCPHAPQVFRNRMKKGL